MEKWRSGTEKMIWAAGFGALATVLVSSGFDRLHEERPAYPEGLVCEVELAPGESPGSLSDASVFAADAKTVIERSQFMNPDALMAYEEGDNKSYGTDEPFNIMVKPRHKDRPDDRPYFEDDYSPYEQLSDCSSNQTAPELVSQYPSAEVGAKILRNTVAVVEESPRENDGIRYRRCGAIMVNEHLLMLAKGYEDDRLACTTLGSGETEQGKLVIGVDESYGPWRYIDVGGMVPEGVELDAGYVEHAQVGDVLVYSGYDSGGSRDYFRVEVAGTRGSELLLKSNVDQIYPVSEVNDSSNSPFTRGTGGLFTLDGKLVALSRDAAQMKTDIFDSGYSDSYKQRLYDYNDWLEGQLEEFGYYQQTYTDSDIQFMFAKGIQTVVANEQ